MPLHSLYHSTTVEIPFETRGDFLRENHGFLRKYNHVIFITFYTSTQYFSADFPHVYAPPNYSHLKTKMTPFLEKNTPFFSILNWITHLHRTRTLWL